MPTAKERLCHLLELAEEGPAQRTALVGELADLLLDWPPDCPPAMRAPVVALLEKTSRETDDGTRARLAARLGGHGELPLDLVNEFFLSAPARVRREILMRNELAGEANDIAAAPDAALLVAAARDARAHDFAERFGTAFGIAPHTAQTILSDASGEALAVLCKGAHLDRATFSAVALLKGAPADDTAAQLSAFDIVPQHAAERLTRTWQIHHPPPEHRQTAAAE
ncbi:MAG: DUF2336 domain-containing protein [Rhizomicrobium sp.]|jgi:hypothetical protein